VLNKLATGVDDGREKKNMKRATHFLLLLLLLVWEKCQQPVSAQRKMKDTLGISHLTRLLCSARSINQQSCSSSQTKKKERKKKIHFFCLRLRNVDWFV
jgi:hypothetical protein